MRLVDVSQDEVTLTIVSHGGAPVLPRSPGWADAREITVTHRRDSGVERLGEELSKITDTLITYRPLAFGQKFVKTTSGSNISLSPDTVLVTLRYYTHTSAPTESGCGEDWDGDGAFRAILEEWGGGF